MQTLIAHFEDPQSPEEATELLRTKATPVPDSELVFLFPGDPDLANYYGAVFSITLPKDEARARLTTNVFKTGEGYEDLGEDGFTRVYYKPMPTGYLPKAAAAAAGRKRKTFKKKSRKYCKKTPCRKMGFTQRSSCRPYKKCSKPSS